MRKTARRLKHEHGQKVGTRQRPKARSQSSLIGCCPQRQWLVANAARNEQVGEEWMTYQINHLVSAPIHFVRPFWPRKLSLSWVHEAVWAILNLQPSLSERGVPATARGTNRLQRLGEIWRYCVVDSRGRRSRPLTQGLAPAEKQVRWGDPPTGGITGLQTCGGHLAQRSSGSQPGCHRCECRWLMIAATPPPSRLAAKAAGLTLGSPPPAAGGKTHPWPVSWRRFHLRSGGGKGRQGGAHPGSSSHGARMNPMRPRSAGPRARSAVRSRRPAAARDGQACAGPMIRVLAHASPGAIEIDQMQRSEPLLQQRLGLNGPSLKRDRWAPWARRSGMDRSDGIKLKTKNTEEKDLIYISIKIDGEEITKRLVTNTRNTIILLTIFLMPRETKVVTLNIKTKSRPVYGYIRGARWTACLKA